MFQIGTVLNIEDAENAKKAGAKFIMSPAIVKACQKLLQQYNIVYDF